MAMVFCQTNITNQAVMVHIQKIGKFFFGLWIYCPFVSKRNLRNRRVIFSETMEIYEDALLMKVEVLCFF